MTSTLPQVPVKCLPNGTIPLENQVAGHTFQAGTDAVGMLKDQHDGSVLKPIGKPLCGEREKRFYETLQNPSHPQILALQNLVPQYKGSLKININGREIDFIKLSDLTLGMQKPCIMDVKIGKRTWDPLASKEKIYAEEEKYAACKKTVGLCIPGFQTYDLKTGELLRFGKDYGKQLNESTLKDAFQLFLNTSSGLCLTLIRMILSGLWSIQKWSHTQTCYKLYSSSILLVYDAIRLKNIRHDENKLNCNITNGTISPRDYTIPSEIHSKTLKNAWQTTTKIDSKYSKVQNLTHNNADDDQQSINKYNNITSIDNLNGSFEENRSWVYVKMIDFAHAFPCDDGSIDTNYLFGIDNLVKIFEEFLNECQ